jgi:hypothetical protein
LLKEKYGKKKVTKKKQKGKDKIRRKRLKE